MLASTSNRPPIHNQFEKAPWLCSGRPQSGRAAILTRNGVSPSCLCCRRWLGGVCRSSLDVVLHLSPIIPPPHHNHHQQRAFCRHQHGTIIPPRSLSLQYGGKVCVPCWSLSHRPVTHIHRSNMGAQTWARSETSLILASFLPFGAACRRHKSQSVVDFSMEQAELQHPFLDRPNSCGMNSFGTVPGGLCMGNGGGLISLYRFPPLCNSPTRCKRGKKARPTTLQYVRIVFELSLRPTTIQPPVSQCPSSACRNPFRTSSARHLIAGLSHGEVPYALSKSVR